VTLHSLHPNILQAMLKPHWNQKDHCSILQPEFGSNELLNMNFLWHFFFLLACTCIYNHI
jgi:hypothetical protein